MLDINLNFERILPYVLARVLCYRGACQLSMMEFLAKVLVNGF